MMKNLFAFLKSRVFLINFAIAIVLLPLLVWLVFAWLNSYTRHEEFVKVPDFKDLKVRQLDDFIVNKDVTYEIIDSLWDPKLQKGVVIRQEPDAGSNVKEGRKVYLYVTASQPPMIEMPELEGKLSKRQAAIICESYGLKCSFDYVDHPDKDLVVEQRYKKKHIAPKTLIEKGSSIVLVIGRGEEASGGDVAIPNLTGLTFRAARGKLIDLGLEWLLIADPGTKDTLNAVVYAQDPPPSRDRKILPGSTIDLRIGNKSKLDTTK